LEIFFLSNRSIELTESLCTLAGVLLGKTSLNWLYGLMGWLPQTVPRFGYPDSADSFGLATAPNE
jgi:hypothetical protein